MQAARRSGAAAGQGAAPLEAAEGAMEQAPAAGEAGGAAAGHGVAVGRVAASGQGAAHLEAAEGAMEQAPADRERGGAAAGRGAAALEAADGGPVGAADGGPGGADAGWSAWADWQQGMDPENIMHMLIAYCDPSKPNEPITEDSTDVQPDNNSKEAGDSYLCNPIPENEHVGIDEEKMYLENEKDKANVPEDGSEDGSEDESEDGSEDESEDGSEDESEEEPELEEELHEPDHAPNTEYDQQDPPMTVGSTYPNMDVFRLALSQHAVKRDFEYNTEKSTQRRLRAYCCNVGY